MDVETSNVQHSDLPSTNIKEDIRNTSKKGRLKFLVPKIFEKCSERFSNIPSVCK